MKNRFLALPKYRVRSPAHFIGQRERMVTEIEKKYGLTSPEVLFAMSLVPRHEFVDKKYQDIAYSDAPVPIGFGQTMSQPYTVAFMTRLLISGKTGKVLEVGTGSGYQAAILSIFFDEVYTIEIIPQLVRKAKKTLEKLGFDNVYVEKGNGEWGWKEKSPFDAIIITAGLDKEIPKPLIEQLDIGGVIVAPLGSGKLKTMTRYTKNGNGSLEKEEFQKYVFVPFIQENN